MTLRLLVGSAEFWQALAGDLETARSYAYLQTLSFEGDRAGRLLGDALRASRCPDRRVLVDLFTRYVLSDKFLYAPANLLDPACRREARDTATLFTELETSGVQLKFTNPAGPLLLWIVARNHKKLIVIDDRIAYIGGINFSDHNFQWHDLMLRIEDPDVAAFLREDFLTTWDGGNRREIRRFPGIEFHLLDGSSNGTGIAPVLDLVANAREHVLVHSPYLTFPYWEPLRRARKRGVRVTLIAPERNNRRSIKRSIQWQAARSGIELWQLQDQMSHLKAMLVDDRWLVLGSSNFDWPSYYLQQEIVAVITRQDLIAEFRARVIEPDLARAVRFQGRVSPLTGRFAELQHRLWARLSVAACRLRFGKGAGPRSVLTVAPAAWSWFEPRDPAGRLEKPEPPPAAAGRGRAGAP